MMACIPDTKYLNSGLDDGIFRMGEEIVAADEWRPNESGSGEGYLDYGYENGDGENIGESEIHLRMFVHFKFSGPVY